MDKKIVLKRYVSENAMEKELPTLLDKGYDIIDLSRGKDMYYEILLRKSKRGSPLAYFLTTGAAVFVGVMLANSLYTLLIHL